MSGWGARVMTLKALGLDGYDWLFLVAHAELIIYHRRGLRGRSIPRELTTGTNLGKTGFDIPVLPQN